jgi:CO dehydrogenase maturation factor
LLGPLDQTGQAVVADLEAGIGTLTRLDDEGVDAVCVVVEPTIKSIEVGVRAADLIDERGLGKVVVVANRVRDDDLGQVRAAFGDRELVAVPDDPLVASAERRGLAPLDTDPEAPAVAALVALADRLAPAPV